ncbi:hypothetical protein DEH18_33335 [Streptomyces sp. NHF165]|uniref:hypothetical protein n=1 Tax=Streptomyces sp. NHF165 TaxID=2175864 RepID=UPI00132F1561|nr:hypothetical protein [Streptomyces sp. NHF165]QHF97915.1 hypothetical protein DEH18_33335 [Streptomyces sp. NHF165]
MNRRKHPERPHRRKPASGDRTRNAKLFRVEASWDSRPDRPAIRTTTDRAAARRLAAQFAERGAYVIVQATRGFEWRTLDEVDGPALLAERQAAEAAERARQEAAQHAQQAAAEERRRHRLAAEASTHAQALMSAPAIVRPENRQRARHITGAQR